MKKQLAGIALILFGILLAVAFPGTSLATIGVALGFIGLILTVWYSADAQTKDEEKKEK